MKALIIIDVQNDFMPKGTLPVTKGDIIVPLINQIMPHFDLIIATQDWHPPNHMSFAANHPGKHPFDKINLDGIEQTLWPNHCVQGTFGAQFHPKLNTNSIETIFRKGTDSNIDSYSGFYDHLKKKKTGLAGYLREKEADVLFFLRVMRRDLCLLHD